ncbi:MAG: holo-ACP synthase [Candidatus Omnitrophica bacterium]|nr:holo-ACP synthase [Candidatus Omnitrophota bacterium]
MVIGSGIDIVEVGRVQAIMDKWQDSFFKKIFTDNELAYAHSKKYAAEHLAARIAIKEALVKAFSNDGKKHLGKWKDVEVSNDKSGRPYLNLYGNFKRVKKKRNIDQIIISASHTHRYAVASVIITNKATRNGKVKS